MFIAHVRTWPEHAPQEATDVTYTTQQHSLHELITLIGKYHKALNRLNQTDTKIQLLSVSDVTESLLMQNLVDVGCVELNSKNVHALIYEAREKESQFKATANLSTEQLSGKVTAEKSYNFDADVTGE